jgi:hypothetical protein
VFGFMGATYPTLPQAQAPTANLWITLLDPPPALSTISPPAPRSDSTTVLKFRLVASGGLARMATTSTTDDWLGRIQEALRARTQRGTAVLPLREGAGQGPRNAGAGGARTSRPAICTRPPYAALMAESGS